MLQLFNIHTIREDQSYILFEQGFLVQGYFSTRNFLLQDILYCTARNMNSDFCTLAKAFHETKKKPKKNLFLIVASRVASSRMEQIEKCWEKLKEVSLKFSRNYWSLRLILCLSLRPRPKGLFLLAWDCGKRSDNQY